MQVRYLRETNGASQIASVGVRAGVLTVDLAARQVSL